MCNIDKRRGLGAYPHNCKGLHLYNIDTEIRQTRERERDLDQPTHFQSYLRFVEMFYFFAKPLIIIPGICHFELL